MTTIKLKNGSGAPTAGDLAQGEPALDLTNKRLYTEDSGGTVIEVGTNPGVDVTFADDRKAIFGAGSDLQIYHDGSNSYITDAGTGDLRIRGASVEIQTGGGNKYFQGASGITRLYHTNNEKFATTATGVNVTGTVTADGGTIVSTGSDAFSSKAVGGYAIQAYQDATSADHTALDLRSDATTGTRYLIRGYNDAAGTPTEVFSVGADGTVTADGLTVDGNGTIQSNASSSVPTLTLNDTDTGISVGQSLGRLSFSSADASPDSAGERAYVRGYLIDGTNYGIDIGAMASGGSPTKRLTVSGSGDISFYEDTGTTAKLFWDASAESLGIGTSSPDTQLTLYKASTNADVNYAKMRMDSWGGSTGKLKSIAWDDNGSPVAAIGAEYDGAKTNIHFHSQYNGGFKGTSDRTMSIMGNGNVGIGTSSPGQSLSVESSSVGVTRVGITNTGNAAAGAGVQFITKNGATQVSNATLRTDNAGNFSIFSGTTTEAERMRIDSSGNLLVGRTSAGSGTGFEANTAFGSYILSTSTSIAGVFDRLSTDGEIVQFRKDGVEVGSIGTADGELTIGNGDAGLYFWGDSDKILPFNTTTNAVRDAGIDLGRTTTRFKDFYLSGRVVADGVTTSAHAWSSQSDSTSSSAHLYFRNPNGFVGNISTSGTATAYNTSSDYRLKENVVAMSGATERLKQLAPKRFNFIADADTTVDGFLAHEVADVVPEAVTGAKDAVDDDGNAVYQGIDQSKLVPLLVATIQELEARIAALESN